MKIETHRELADFIAGKRIMHMNSLGKDSILCLEWLTKFAAPSHIVSVNYGFLAPHPGDAVYMRYLKNRYPQVEFLTFPNPIELSRVLTGTYQSPVFVINELNDGDVFEHDTFDHQKVADDLRKEYGCDYLCYGLSRYESFDRANYFHRKGLVDDTFIYPLGMMSKAQVLTLLRDTGIKIHPSYKLAKSTLDKPNYYKMRSAFITYPEYKKRMYAIYPMLELDEYRYERLLK